MSITELYELLTPARLVIKSAPDQGKRLTDQTVTRR